MFSLSVTQKMGINTILECSPFSVKLITMFDALELRGKADGTAARAWEHLNLNDIPLDLG